MPAADQRCELVGNSEKDTDAPAALSVTMNRSRGPTTSLSGFWLVARLHLNGIGLAPRVRHIDTQDLFRFVEPPDADAFEVV